MRRPRLWIGVAGAAAAALVLRRRRGGAREEHVDLYYADGSMVSLENGVPESAELLSIARRGLGTVRTARP